MCAWIQFLYKHAHKSHSFTYTNINLRSDEYQHSCTNVLDCIFFLLCFFYSEWTVGILHAVYVWWYYMQCLEHICTATLFFRYKRHFRLLYKLFVYAGFDVCCSLFFNSLFQNWTCTGSLSLPKICCISKLTQSQTHNVDFKMIYLKKVSKLPFFKNCMYLFKYVHILSKKKSQNCSHNFFSHRTETAMINSAQLLLFWNIF